MENRQRKTWTDSEKQYLIDNWGELTPNVIARNMGRTLNAIIIMAKNLSLGSFLANSEYLNACQITKLMGVDTHVVSRTWKKHGFQMINKRVRGKNRFQVIRMDQLMKWLSKHQELWDSRNIPLYAFGTEPVWLKQKRQHDLKTITTKRRGTKYSAEEDARIVFMYRKGKTQKEIGLAIGRSEASINARIQRLDIWGTGKLKEAE